MAFAELLHSENLVFRLIFLCSHFYLTGTIYMYTSFRREMNYFSVSFKRFEFIFGIGKTISGYGQIRMMTLLMPRARGVRDF